MSVTADESGPANSSPAELSEADRAAWLRIEPALRGMRWWLLFLAAVVGLWGSFLLITTATAIAFDELLNAQTDATL